MTVTSIFARIFARLALALALAAAAGCSPVRGIEAARLLFDVARADVADAASVPRSAVAYRADGTARRADLYAPEDRHAALVLVPGAADRAMDDPRLVNFADALRERGFLVLVPELAGEGSLQVSAGDADAIEDAARHLLELGGPGPIGMAALSYAVGPTVQAALRDGVRQETGFVVAVGGYHDVVAAITYLTTGAYRDEPSDPWFRADVDARAKWIFLQANAGRAGDPRDAARLEAIARARLARQPADVGALAARLGPEARAILELVANEDPDRVPALIEALPVQLRDEIASLDLSTIDLSALEADLILVHGRNDPLVPYTESLDLAHAVGSERASLHLLDNLHHVDIGTPTPADLATLLRAAYRILSYRNAAPNPPDGPAE